MKGTYKVEVTRTSVRCVVIEVEADSCEDAILKADEKSADIDFGRVSESGVEYYSSVEDGPTQERPDTCEADIWEKMDRFDREWTITASERNLTFNEHIDATRAATDHENAGGWEVGAYLRNLPHEQENEA